MKFLIGIYIVWFQHKFIFRVEFVGYMSMASHIVLNLFLYYLMYDVSIKINIFDMKQSHQ